MHFVLIFCLIVGVYSLRPTADDYDDWEIFKAKYGKVYKTRDHYHRSQIFFENRKMILEHNKLYENGFEHFEMGLNQFSDLTHEEFLFQYTNLEMSFEQRSENNSTDVYQCLGNVTLPESINWKDMGAVTEIKDQGQCGSCWSFSATGALEGQHFRKTGVLVSISEQNLVDCSASYGNKGCHGGWMNQAFQYIKDNDGIDTEKSYPYHARVDNCKYNAQNSGATVVGFSNIARGNEVALQQAISNIGPISVAIDASNPSFMFYRSGIYYDKHCSPQNLNHAVLVVGYGNNANNIPYYIVKNSWGTTWGDRGFFKIARNRKNHCGIASAASYPLV